jgi:hypothetical protein
MLLLFSAGQIKIQASFFAHKAKFLLRAGAIAVCNLTIA